MPLKPVAGTCALAIFVIVSIHDARAAKKPAEPPPASQPVEEPTPDRKTWEKRVIFYGDEATGEWSLRIRETDVDRQRPFIFREIWQYDREKKRWIKLNTTPISSVMVPAARRHKNPDDDETEILAYLPVERDQGGLYYAKWKVNDVSGSTYCRVGPGLDDPNALPTGKQPEGMIVAVVPIDLRHSQALIIPDPRIACDDRN